MFLYVELAVRFQCIWLPRISWASGPVLCACVALPGPSEPNSDDLEIWWRNVDQRLGQTTVETPDHGGNSGR